MQRHAFSEINNKYIEKNQNRISINCFQPKQSKFLKSIYIKSEEENEYQSEKSNTYRQPGLSNSEFFSEFNIENELMPFRMKSTVEDEAKAPHKPRKTKKNFHTFIGHFRFYFHCSVCLTIISGESNLIYKISYY